MSLAILGAGAFGTALAIALARHDRPVTLWARSAETVERITATRSAPRLPDVILPDNITATTNLHGLHAADTWLLAVPAQQLRGVLQQIDDPLTGRHLVLCCKGIDLVSGQSGSASLAELKPQAEHAVLTGPSFAADIAKGLPTALTLACAKPVIAHDIQHRLATPVLRLYRSADVLGAELGGALKNVMAIACGACIGAGLGDSARAALMTRGFAEMRALAVKLGAQPETLSGLSGLGDLTLTCTSDLSRNYRYGKALGDGTPFDPNITVEGAATARAAATLADRHGVGAPICTATAALTEGRLTVSEAMDHLLSRPLKEE